MIPLETIAEGVASAKLYYIDLLNALLVELGKNCKGDVCKLQELQGLIRALNYDIKDEVNDDTTQALYVKLLNEIDGYSASYVIDPNVVYPYAPAGSVNVNWGNIVGIISNQTDLINYISSQIATTSPVKSVNGRTGIVTGLAEQASLQAEITRATNAEGTKANISGQVFTGAISAPNLSGTNTGDQTKTSLGLSNVDNTSDVNKPVSTSQQAALDLKATITSVTNETTARQAADSIEQTARIVGDNTLTTRVDTNSADILKSVEYGLVLTATAGQNFIQDARLVSMIPKGIFRGKFYTVGNASATPTDTPPLVAFDVTTGRITTDQNFYADETVWVLYSQLGNTAIVPGSVALQSDLANYTKNWQNLGSITGQPGFIINFNSVTKQIESSGSLFISFGPDYTAVTASNTAFDQSGAGTGFGGLNYLVFDKTTKTIKGLSNIKKSSYQTPNFIFLGSFWDDNVDTLSMPGSLLTINGKDKVKTWDKIASIIGETINYNINVNISTLNLEVTKTGNVLFLVIGASYFTIASGNTAYIKPSGQLTISGINYILFEKSTGQLLLVNYQSQVPYQNNNYVYVGSFLGVDINTLSILDCNFKINGAARPIPTPELPANLAYQSDVNDAKINAYKRTASTTSADVALSSVTAVGGDYTDQAFIWTSLFHKIPSDGFVKEITLRTKDDISALTAPQKVVQIFAVSIPTLGAAPYTVVSEVREFSVIAGTNIISITDLFIPKDAYLAIKSRTCLYPTLTGDKLYQVGATTTFNNLTLSFSFKLFGFTLSLLSTLELMYNKANKAITYEKLAGLKFSVLGDSISTFTGLDGVANPYYPTGDITTVDQVWWGKIIARTGMILNRCNAIGGTKIINKAANDISNRTGLLFSSGGTGTAPDVIFLFGGINDFINNGGTVLGSFADGDTDNTLSFYSAYRFTIKSLIATYPNARVFGLTPMKNFGWNNITNVPQINATGQKLTAFIDAIKECNSAYGIQTIDLYTNIQFTQNNYTQYLNDGLHPKLKGTSLMEAYIVNKLAEYYI